MRGVHLTIIVLLAAVIIIFVFQNREIATMSFLGFSVRAPLAVTVAVTYILGAATGGSLFALIRQSYHGSRRARAAPG